MSSPFATTKQLQLKYATPIALLRMAIVTLVTTRSDILTSAPAAVNRISSGATSSTWRTGASDHIWTSLEKPDGANGALELYSHNMTSTKCDDDGTCYFYIRAIDEMNVIHVYNMYTHPSSFTDVNFFYRAAMFQSWNKFCCQGGMLAVRAQHREAGMPEDFRLFRRIHRRGTFIPASTATVARLPGANNLDVPTAYYKQQRGHKSRYQGLRYASNNECTQDATLNQNYNTIAASLKAGLTEKSCFYNTRPASNDVHTDNGGLELPP